MPNFREQEHLCPCRWETHRSRLQVHPDHVQSMAVWQGARGWERGSRDKGSTLGEYLLGGHPPPRGTQSFGMMDHVLLPHCDVPHGAEGWNHPDEVTKDAGECTLYALGLMPAV